METPPAQQSSKQSRSSKIPTVLQGPASQMQVASCEAIEARLAQKLRSQINPSRIPQSSVPQATHVAGSPPLKPTAAKHGQQATDSSAQQCCHGTAQQLPSLPNVRQNFRPGELSPPRQRNQQPAYKLSPAGGQHQWSPRKQQQKEQQLPPQVRQQHHRHGLQTSQQQQQGQQHKVWPTQQQRDHSDCNSQQQRQPQQQRSHRAMHSSLHYIASNSGWTASQKLHEFLLHQQHKREQYWLSKYGKMLGQTASQSLRKPCPNPASMFRHPAAAATYGHGAAAAAVNRSSSSQLRLPQLPSTRSQASITAEPHSASLGSAREGSSAQQPSVLSSRHLHDTGVADHSAALKGSSSCGCLGVSEQLPAVAGAAASRGTRADDSSSGGGGSGGWLQDKDSSLQQQQQQQDTAADAAFERIKAQITLASVPQLSVTTGCGGSSSSKAKLQPVRQLPCRDLESELQVLRSIHGREAAVDKLKACCNKISAAAATAGDARCSSVWLLPSDPMGRLFYRLVSNYCQKTLEVIEAHAAWQRKVSGPPEPYSYKGQPYLLTMGEVLGFLDAAIWLAGRLVHCQAVQDVLLVEVTPDGVPLDGVTSFDLRHGPSHLFNPEALRMHMARKVLAAAGATLPPDTSHSLAAAIQQQQQQQQLGSSQHPVTHVQEEPLADPPAQHRAAATAADHDSLPTKCSSDKREAASAAAAAAFAILSAHNSPRDATFCHSAFTAGQSAASQAVSIAACDTILQGSNSCDRASAIGSAGDDAAAQMPELERLQGLEQQQQHAELQQQQQQQQQLRGVQQLVPTLQGWLLQQELQQIHTQVTEAPVVSPSGLCADAAAALGSHAMLPHYQQQQQWWQQQQQPLGEHQADCCAWSESAVIDKMLDELVASLEHFTACSISELDAACSTASSATASLDDKAGLAPMAALAGDTSTLTVICGGDSSSSC